MLKSQRLKLQLRLIIMIKRSNKKITIISRISQNYQKHNYQIYNRKYKKCKKIKINYKVIFKKIKI